jgi:steroid 5-alpha reductase family enzyme
MKYIQPLFTFIVGWIILLIAPPLSHIASLNAIAQLVLFGLVVCLPIYKTGRLCYVDIGWPWGLVVIGLLTLLFSEGHPWRVWIVSGIYMFIGLRMGVGALVLWKNGYMEKEFPRYEFQKHRWSKAGKTNVPLAMQIDAMTQGLANVSFLAFPAFIMGWNANPSISFFEIVGFIIWVLAFIMEATADAQKLTFLRKMASQGLKKKVCEVGLWKYTRHPNYFAEWMVWNALVIATIPSFIELQSDLSLVVWILLGLGLLFVSRIMYLTLVYLTGAVPSEYYSAQKRPDYKAYQDRVNMFFPGLPRK